MTAEWTTTETAGSFTKGAVMSGVSDTSFALFVIGQHVKLQPRVAPLTCKSPI